ncbi:MAG TPA: hypothetical protein VGK67_16585 [Myxococcales bacterium]|jgi:mono/diheme cytochrome c family protein
MHARLRLLAVLPLLAALGCGGAGSSSSAPSSHTVNEGGVMHKPGLASPLTNCTGCHGSDLSGSGSAPSCTSCHGQKW